MDSRWSMFFLAWLVSLVATAGSLFFSEVMSFMPCVLCWYQRIAMYPLVILMMQALIRKEFLITPYALSLSVIGAVIALYHNLLHWQIIPEDMSPCVQGVPCSTVYINWLGFVTIPLLSLIGFAIIVVILIMVQFNKRG